MALGNLYANPRQMINLKKVEFISINKLKDNPQNYKKHPEDQLNHIIKSIKSHGFYKNVVIAKDHTILAGHGVVQAARKMGLKYIPVVKLNISPTHPKAIKLMIGDNEISRSAETDDRVLTELLKDIRNIEMETLEGTGFNNEQLSALIMNTRPENEILNKSKAEEWIGMPGYNSAPICPTIVISFPKDSDREKFIKKLNIKIIHK